MLRDLVNSLPTWPLAVVSALCLALVAYGALVLVHRRWPELQSGEHNDASAAVVTLAGTLFAIVLGFVIITNYTRLDSTDTAVHTEAAQIAQLWVDTRSMPGLTEPMTKLMHGYLHEIVEVDWPAMKAGDAGIARDKYLIEMVSTMQAYEPKTASEVAYYSDAVGRINDIVQFRRLRLSAAEGNLPSVLVGMIFIGALLMLLLSLTFGVRRFALHAILVCGAAAFIAFTVVLAISLAYPFSGDIGIGNEMYRTGVLATLWESSG